MTMHALSLSDMLSVARDTVEAFPQGFRDLAQQVVLRVEEWPPKDILADMGINDPLELTGLYDGIPVTEKALSDPSPFPDVVWLFRQPILSEWHDRQDIDLTDLVAHVTVHEFAHHFGWSDDDIARIDRWWE